ncbi:hypothetical protein H5410_060655 [Solanum commersonii]|uniref:Uncharacterized protein n=1 Tax=Solanum commersonii TaxID=4109 RepID=A0A9J5W620_SOLCO|nr:hypothetical protein H5410_060655 [Solanum commersonii]
MHLRFDTLLMCLRFYCAIWGTTSLSFTLRRIRKGHENLILHFIRRSLAWYPVGEISRFTFGHLMHTDHFTTNANKVSFTRILIKEKHVEYKWQPRYCNVCLRYGHSYETVGIATSQRKW